jgi:hypothetical protein
MAIDWLFKKYPRGKKTCDYCNTTRWGLARPNFPFLQPGLQASIAFIVARTGLSYSYLKHRLDVLARKPNKFLDRPVAQRSQPNANYRFLIYELAFRGETVLGDHLLYSKEPLFGDKKFFPHSLMVSETIVSLEMGNIRHADGSISGFIGYSDGVLKLPPKWLPAASNVVTFPKKSA